MVFEEYLNGIHDVTKRDRLAEVLTWIHETYPDLAPVVKWNTPMFTDHGTYIIGVDEAKQHISISPEPAAMTKFSDDISASGYSQTKGLYRVKYTQEVDYQLLKNIIDFNIEDKKQYDKFWR